VLKGVGAWCADVSSARIKNDTDLLEAIANACGVASEQTGRTPRISNKSITR
jgi:hypothetical protein